jgi:arylformamidase
VSSPYLDISVPLDGSTPVWPNTPGVSTSLHMAIAAGADANATKIVIDAHCGTHVDAPRHFVDGGATLDQIGLDPFVGDAWIVDVTGHTSIDAAVLEAAAVPASTRRLLLRSDNSLRADLRTGPFRDDYAALTPDAARWVVDREIALIGIDYLSIQLFHDGPETHQIILGAGVAILEGLDLSEPAPGSWQLVCLPLKLIGIEAAPARAVLFPPEVYLG